MPQPRLQHPITITIEVIDKASTPYDEDAREPLRVARRATKTFPAQVRYRRQVEPERTVLGTEEEVTGRLTTRKVDLAAISYTPRRGDRITKIGKDATELYLVTIELLGHYPDQNGATLKRLYFADRRPSASTPDMG